MRYFFFQFCHFLLLVIRQFITRFNTLEHVNKRQITRYLAFQIVYFFSRVRKIKQHGKFGRGNSGR